jgi:hypothetical protein
MTTPTTTRVDFNTNAADIIQKFESGVTNEELLEQQRQASVPFPGTVTFILADRLPGQQVTKP